MKSENEIIKKYDGLTIKKTGKYMFIGFNIDEALKQKNPRNVFLNGHLYIEFFCDAIIKYYFDIDNKIKDKVFSDFLESGNCSFSLKIWFMDKLMKYDENNLLSPERLIDKKIINSLHAISEVRNSFQHNLNLDMAFEKLVKKSDRKFTFIRKKLSQYKELDKLIEDFKKEVKELYNELEKINSSLVVASVTKQQESGDKRKVMQKWEER